MTTLKSDSDTAKRVLHLAETIACRCRESGLPPSKEIKRADYHSLTPGERTYVLRAGLIYLVGNRLHEDRSVSIAERISPSGNEVAAVGTSNLGRRSVLHPVQGRNPTAWKALHTQICGEDGKLKSLLQFTSADLSKLESESTVNENSWARRRDWARAAREACTKYEVGVVNALPAKVLKRLDAVAVNAWGR